jgi:hypothetical protein
LESRRSKRLIAILFGSALDLAKDVLFVHNRTRLPSNARLHPRRAVHSHTRAEIALRPPTGASRS